MAGVTLNLSFLLANAWLILGATVVLAIVGGISFMIYLRMSRPKNAPPMLGGGLPLLGPFPEFASSPVDLVWRGYREKGTEFTVNMFGKNMTFLLGPQSHTPFFNAADKDVNQSAVYKFMTPVFGKGVVYDAPPRVMQQQLKFMSGSLHSSNLQSYVPKIIDEAEKFFKDWGDEGEVNLIEKLAELIILTASRCLMGQEIREELFEQVADLYHTLDQGITPLSFFFPNAPIPQHIKRNRAREEMVRLFSNVIQKRRREGERHNDVLQVFMDAEYRDGSKPTDQEVTGLMIALLFAGQHTSTITSTWTALYLMTKPDLKERVLQEQQELVGGAQDTLSFEQVNKMDLLGRCMKESIRLHPPLIFLMREVLTELKTPHHTIPKGDIVVAAPGVSMQLPPPEGAFSNPQQFDPDRYAPGREEDKPKEGEDNKKFKYVGFGGGLHSCMGERFAYLQVKTLLSVLFRNFDLELVTEFPEPDYTAMVVPPKSPTTVRYRRKKSGPKA
eukprot:gb/GECG01014661.1/.p1 GENE.gb/GECG01014661.1/~~gb/GECG01014661.1/.p1  ORF type:complete len:501 (+),score=68.80 gb/GECG01014661.1/:1-1503(+)